MMLLEHIGIYLLLKYFDTYGLFGTNINNVENTRNMWIPGTIEKSHELAVDHFNETDRRVWTMRYFENVQCFHNGPIIFEINGVHPDPAVGTYSDFSRELAAETYGALFANEHRYSGDSHTQFNQSLRYLTTRQSLADIASLLRTLKGDPRFRNSKVVVVGGSYAGSLAAWMRLLYPDLVDAAHASSAPLLAKTDCPECIGHVEDIFKAHCDPEDYEGIKKRFEYYETLIKTDAGKEQFLRDVGACHEGDALQNPNDLYTIFQYLLLPFVTNTVFGNTQNFNQNCKNINYNINKSGFIICQTGHCIPSYEQELKFWYNNSRLGLYQMCTEFGHFPTISPKKKLFTLRLPVGFYYSLCSEVLGPAFGEESVRKGVENMNRLYEELNRNVTRVVFVNGELDPASRLSVMRDLSPEAPAYVMRGVGRSADLWYSYEHVTPEVYRATQLSKSMIKKWIWQ